jgi:hypothetical protein
MRTWSIAGCIDRVTIAVVDAQAFAAVTVQGLIDAAHTVEQLTRPVRRERDGAEELAEREAEEECSEPGLRCYFGHHPFSTCMQDCQCPEVLNPVSGQHNSSDRLCVYTGEKNPLAICGVCRPVRDIVEQMIEERFGPALSDDEASRIASEEIRLMRAEKTRCGIHDFTCSQRYK